MNGLLVLAALPTFFAITVDPSHYEARVFSGEPPAGAQIVATANYSWLGTPIGVVCQSARYLPTGVKPIRTIPLLGVRKDRPALEIGPFANITHGAPVNPLGAVIQAGPTLVTDGEVSVGTIAEKFQDDAVRRTKHVAYGTTATGLLVIAYADNMSANELAVKMRAIGCRDAMKADGGHLASLTITGSLAVSYGRKGALPCGLALFQRGA